jgi:hypothetical protein
MTEHNPDKGKARVMARDKVVPMEKDLAREWD